MPPKMGVRTTSIVSLSSFVGAMPPSTHKVASKETSEASIEEVVEVTKPTFPIFENTHCFIDKTTEVTLGSIKYTFMQKRFVENLEDVQEYINIKKS